MNGSQNLINGIGSPGWLPLNRDDFSLLSAQPDDECCKMSHVDLSPTKVLIAEVFPEELEMVGSRSAGIGATTKIIKEL